MGGFHLYSLSLCRLMSPASFEWTRCTVILFHLSRHAARLLVAFSTIRYCSNPLRYLTETAQDMFKTPKDTKWRPIQSADPVQAAQHDVDTKRTAWQAVNSQDHRFAPLYNAYHEASKRLLLERVSCSTGGSYR